MRFYPLLSHFSKVQDHYNTFVVTQRYLCVDVHTGTCESTVNMLSNTPLCTVDYIHI